MRYPARLALLWLLWATGCAAPPGGGDPCAVERLAEMPLTMAELLPRVAAHVNGKPALLMVDTGASGTILTAEAARRLGVTANPDIRFHASAVGGQSSHHAVMLQTLTLGAVTVTDVLAAELSFPLPNFGDPPIDGILGVDVLNRYDVEIDGPGQRMTLYRPRFCPGGPVPWAEPHVVLPRPSSPRSLPYNVIGVRLDGQEVAAVVDTGANQTTVNTQTARMTGVPADVLSVERSRPVTGVAATPGRVWRHTFREIEIAGQRYARPVLSIIDLGDTADMLIGQDFLASRRMWLSFGSDTVYFTRARQRAQ